MSVQPDPPIQIDPNMDSGHQWAFVNQNFASIANVLGKQSFNIVLSGTVTGSTIAAAGTERLTVPHNLGFIPIPMVYLSDGGLYLPIPAISSYSPSVTGITIATYSADFTDAANLYIDTTNGTASPAAAFTYKYYLLQLTAN